MSNLAKIRKEKQLTQKKLAEKIGITREMLSRYENGRVKRLNYKVISKWAKELDFEEDDILVEIKKEREKNGINFQNSVSNIYKHMEKIREFDWGNSSKEERNEVQRKIRMLKELSTEIEENFVIN